MDATQVIFTLCSAGGLVIVAGCVWLLAKQKIYLDRESKQISEIELPLGIKLKSATPVVILFGLGAALLIYSVSQASEHSKQMTEMDKVVNVHGDLSGDNDGVSLYAALVSASVPGAGGFDFSVPMPHPNKAYTLLYLVNGRIVAHQQFDPATNKPLDRLEINAHTESVLAGDIAPRPAGF